ncbi:DUF6044 family protein [Algoriphagus sp.]|uniref:DUF6044 family protein n=1 Tax=Algoriphagus sp. TaxID=1872435 RepID=UPI00261F1C1C|nr:DUF6044 family protein [Algoriphagus sp.]
MNFWKSNKFGLGGLLLFFLPYLLLGSNSIWYANDYLELVVPWYKLVIDQEAIFKSNNFPILGMLDQLPRGVFASEFFIKTWLFYFFQPYTAVLVNKILIHCIAYFSFIHILSHFFKNRLKSSQIQWISLAWATLGFWPEAGIAVAAFPTIAYLFYSAGKGKKLNGPRALIILFYSCYSLLHLHGLFVGIIAFIYGIGIWINSKSFPKSYVRHFVLFTLLASLANYRHFLLFFGGSFTPHRLEYNPHSFAGFYEKFWPTFFEFLSDGTLHSVIFNPLILWGALILGVLGLFRPSKPAQKAGMTLILALLIVFFAVGSRYLPLIERMPIVVPVWYSWDRFIFVAYPLIFLSLSFSLIHLNREFKTLDQLISFSFLLIISYNFLVIDNNHRNYVLKPVLGLGEKYPSFQAFFAEQQFDEIKREIQTRGGGKVASIGIHPGISSFNGLHALDGYTGNYPLEYKRQFGAIIQPELGKSGTQSDLYQHFFGWGNKAYLFNEQLGDDFMRFKWKSRTPLKTQYNLESFKSMGGRFIISTEVLDQEMTELLRIFEDSESAWTIYVYEVH